MTEELWATGAEIRSITPVGSLRRFAPDVGDIALLAVTEARQVGSVLDAVTKLPRVRKIAARKPASVTVTTDRSDITIHLAAQEAAGPALACFTGSARHVH